MKRYGHSHYLNTVGTINYLIMMSLSFRNLLFVSQCTHTIVKRAMATSVKFTRITPTPSDDGSSPLSRSSHGISYLNNGKLVIYGGEHIARTPIEDSSQSLWLAEKSSDNVWKSVRLAIPLVPCRM